MKILKCGSKNTRFGYFWDRILKAYNIFKTRTLEFVKNEILIHTGNFGIWSVFSKDLGSTFSEDPGLGPFYKICRDHLTRC